MPNTHQLDKLETELIQLTQAVADSVWQVHPKRNCACLNRYF